MKRSAVARRSFLGGIATAAAAAASAAGTAEAAPAAAGDPPKLAPPPAVLAQAETGPVMFTVDRWHVANPGSDHMIDIIKQLGYDYITCTPGSTFRGFQESITNYGGNSKPELLTSTHEEISAAMSHGYYKSAGKPMACIVHNTVGLQHASMAIYNAFSDRVPMMIFVGNIADQANRRPGVEWFHTATDVAAIVRGYVKYDTQPASMQAWGEETFKAHSMSLTPMRGPVLVVIDGDLQENPVTEKLVPMPAFAPVRPPVADPGALAEVAKYLVNARSPVIVADRMANTQAGMEHLVALAESLQIPVVDQKSRLNFPSNHHLNQSYDGSLIPQADVILALEPSDLFGIVASMQDLAIRTTSMRIKPGTVVISISSMYSAGQGNYQDQQRFYEPTLELSGDGEASLPYLVDAVNAAITSERRAQNAAREAHFRDAYAKRVQNDIAQAALGWDASPISTPRLTMEVWNQLKGDPSEWTFVSALGACRGFALSLWYNTSMSGHFVSSDRDTPMLMSPSLQDWLPDNHLARLIVETVERLDLRAIEDSYTGRGERAYRPKMLVALLLYGYATGVFSSRKLERSCFDSVAFRFIAANTSPDHDTINDFRKRILPDLPGIFLQVLLVAKELGVLTVGQISLDGSKIKANASKHRALSYGYTGKLKARLRREIVRLMKLAEAAESERDPQIDIPAEIARRETLITKIDEARAKIEEREALRHAEVRAKHAERLAQRKEQQRQGKKPRGPRPRLPKLRVEPTAQVNLTDEESRIMPTADSFVQGYNAQAGVSIGSQFVIYAEVTQDTNDKQQLVPAVIGLQALPEILGACSDVVADAGYYSEANALACEAAGVTPYLSMSRQKHHGWLDAQLRKPDSEPSADASPAERMAFRLQTPDGRELYAKRKSTVEPVFGIAKSAMGFRTFLLRGLEKVGGEWKLVCTAYNLKHLHALVAACPVARAPA